MSKEAIKKKSKKAPPRFTLEVKQKAITMLVARMKSRKQIAQELGTGESSIHYWVKSWQSGNFEVPDIPRSAYNFQGKLEKPKRPYIRKEESPQVRPLQFDAQTKIQVKMVIAENEYLKSILEAHGIAFTSVALPGG